MGRDHSDPRAHQLNLQIKVLIPKPSSSTVIGKHGAVIRRLSELSGCRFTLGDESDPYGTRERIVSVQGTSTSTLTTVNCFHFFSSHFNVFRMTIGCSNVNE